MNNTIMMVDSSRKNDYQSDDLMQKIVYVLIHFGGYVLTAVGFTINQSYLLV